MKPVPLTPLEFIIAAQSFDAAVQERVPCTTRAHPHPRRGDRLDADSYLYRTYSYTAPIARLIAVLSIKYSYNIMMCPNSARVSCACWDFEYGVVGVCKDRVWVWVVGVGGVVVACRSCLLVCPRMTSGAKTCGSSPAVPEMLAADRHGLFPCDCHRRKPSVRERCLSEVWVVV